VGKETFGADNKNNNTKLAWESFRYHDWEKNLAPLYFYSSEAESWCIQSVAE